MSQQRISKQDLEARFVALQGGVESGIEDRKQTIMAVAGGVAFLVIVVIFLLGRRSGKKKTTIVEIRRV